MAEVLIVGDNTSVQQWSLVLARAGHTVETIASTMDMQDRFAGPDVDVLIVDISHADWGEAMLIPQARATWPKCRIIAVASNYAFRSSAVYQMGLWTPDQLLMKPVIPRILSATVAFLWAQIRSDKIREAVATIPLARDGDDPFDRPRGPEPDLPDILT